MRALNTLILLAVLICNSPIHAEFVSAGGINQVEAVDQSIEKSTTTIYEYLSLPFSATITTTVVGAAATQSFNGTLDSLSWNATDTTSGSHPLNTETIGTSFFSASSNEAYEFTNTWDGRAVPGNSDEQISIQELTGLSPILYSLDLRYFGGTLTSISQTGSPQVELLAGQEYVVQFVTALYSIGNSDGTPYTASGGLVFAPSVPEPSSFALMGLGGIGLAFGAYRRCRIVSVSI